MADKRSELPSSSSDNIELKRVIQLSNNNKNNLSQPIGATCSCTKISTMQLFYEMKQKFPTVPDNVVYEYVGRNCHDRSACINSLEVYPNSVNVYPQALRNQKSKKHSKHQSISRVNHKTNNNHNKHRSQMGAMIDKQNKAQSTNAPHFGIMENSTCDDSSLAQVKSKENSSKNDPVLPARRPVALSLTPNDLPKLCPTRTAPPPPIHQQLTAASANEIGNTSGTPVNLSLNVSIVSPISNNPPTRPPRSTQSASVSFTLHQRGNSNPASSMSNVQKPSTSDNEVVNGPSLKYTSNAYDTESGCQSRLEITVAGTNPVNANVLTTTGSSNDCMSLPSVNSSRVDGNTSRLSALGSLPSVVASSEFLEETERVHHQLLCKQKLVLELEKDRKRLERMQRELRALQTPIPDGGMLALTTEVETLRKDCNYMVQQVEDAGPSYALGETNEAFYKNTFTGPQLVPHRPAPPVIVAISQMNSSQTPSTADLLSLPQQNVLPMNPSGTIPTNHAKATQVPNNQNPHGSQSMPVNQEFSQQPRPPNNLSNQTTTDNCGWTCNLCTFQNKYTQRTCEACTMPFLSAGNIDYSAQLMLSLPIQSQSTANYLPIQSLPVTEHNSLPLHYLVYQPTTNIQSTHQSSQP